MARGAARVIPGLDAGRRYRVSVPAPGHLEVPLSASQHELFAGGLVLPGALLGSAGIALPELQPESALILELVADD